MIHTSHNRIYAKDDINKKSITGINETPVISLFVIFFYFPDAGGEEHEKNRNKRNEQ